jgi:D-arabinose 1-dehydrogenase-like Zn-dependent alcohol dehydrogenase
MTETPEPKGSEVLIAVQNCGICHSDLHFYDGYFDLGQGHKMPIPALKKLPFISGHEVQGRVMALGPDATGVEIGKAY